MRPGQHMYTDQLLRPPRAILIGLNTEMFVFPAYLTYHETSYLSSNHIGQYLKIACIYE